MHPWQSSVHKLPRIASLNLNSKTPTPKSTMNASVENQSQEMTVSMTPGFLESSEEYISMQPFKDHPRQLAANEQR